MSPKTTLVAFLIEGPAAGIPGFRRSIVMPASQSQWEEKIRKEARCPDAEVQIIQPEEWNPPKLSAVSQQELTEKSHIILDRIMCYIVDKGLEIDPRELVGGTVVLNPVSGKVFFAYKL